MKDGIFEKHDMVWVDKLQYASNPNNYHKAGWAEILSCDKDLTGNGVYIIRFKHEEDEYVVSANHVHANKPEMQEGKEEGTFHDNHYKECVLEPILVMQDMFTTEEFIGFLRGNILKYRLRMGHKDNVQKEMDKIKRYEEWLYMVQAGKRIEL